MNNEKRSGRHERKKLRELYITAIAMILIATGIGVALTIAKRPSPVAAKPEQDIESYIRSQVSETQVAPGHEAVALYNQRPGRAGERFCCVGTILNDREYGIVLITAEHVFRTDIPGPQTVSIRPLRNIDVPTYYVDRIVKTSREFGGQDAVMATFGTNPVAFQPFSRYVSREIAKGYYCDVAVGKTKVPELRSLVSGKTVKTIGYCRQGEDTNGPIFIMIECHVRPGESGTGFIDDHDGLYIVHASPDASIEKDLLDEYSKLTGRRVSGAATVSGPFGGHYEK